MKHSEFPLKINPHGREIERVRANPILPAVLILCTHMMEETNCSFWVRGQVVSGTQVAMSFSFPPQYLNSLQMNWAQVLSFPLLGISWQCFLSASGALRWVFISSEQQAQVLGFRNQSLKIPSVGNVAMPFGNCIPGSLAMFSAWCAKEMRLCLCPPPVTV